MQGAWAQTVNDESELHAQVQTSATVVLGADIQLSTYLNISGVSVTINLNGHRLYRELGSPSSAGHVIYVHNNAALTLDNSTGTGIIEGGKAYLLKWNNGFSQTTPCFRGVEITNTYNHTTVGGVTFKGTFVPYTLPENDKSLLFLGPRNVLYYSVSNGIKLNSFRGYFELDSSAQLNSVRRYEIKFD